MHMCHLPALLLAAVVLSPHASAGEDSVSSRTIKVVVLEGSPRERGMAHGRALRPQIAAGIAAWKAALEKNYGITADIFIERFLAKTNFLPAIRKWTPDLLEEVKGIAEGSGIEFPTILAFQLIDELWAHGKLLTAEHCSSLGIGKAGVNPSVVAQNMDLEGFRDGSQVLLHIKSPSDPVALVFTQAGVIALNGLNNRGVGVVVNTLSQLSFSREGLPVAFVIRGVLASESLEKAAEFLKRVPHASGQNYIVGGPQEVQDYEASAGKVVRLSPPAGGSVIYHTNHPLANDDYHAQYRELVLTKPASPAKGNSQVRYDALKRHLRRKPSGDLRAWIESALRSRDSEIHPVCRRLTDESETFTFGSTIMLLGEVPEIWVSAGPPDQYPYRRFSFQREPATSSAR